MPSREHLTPGVPWVELRTSADDWDAADPGLLLGMLGQGLWIRAFEEYVLELAGQGLVHGPAHSSIGQEGGAVGSLITLRSDDYVNGSHRGHHQFLAKAFGHVLPAGTGKLPELTDDVRMVLRRTLAEICGLADGFCRGRGGSMHLMWREAGAMGTNAIVGGGVPQAAGFAWNQRASGTDAVTVTYFGDGAVNIGSVLETFNLAAAWKVPLCFFIENNQYAVSTPVTESTAETRLSARGSAFGIPSWRVDGMDPLAVHLAMTEALEHMRSGGGPTIVPPERPLPRQRLRLPRQGRGAGLARPRRPRTAALPRAAPQARHRPADHRRAEGGRSRHARAGRRLPGGAARWQARRAAGQSLRLARPGLCRRRCAR